MFVFFNKLLFVCLHRAVRYWRHCVLCLSVRAYVPRKWVNIRHVI